MDARSIVRHRRHEHRGGGGVHALRKRLARARRCRTARTWSPALPRGSRHARPDVRGCISVGCGAGTCRSILFVAVAAVGKLSFFALLVCFWAVGLSRSRSRLWAQVSSSSERCSWCGWPDKRLQMTDDRHPDDEDKNRGKRVSRAHPHRTGHTGGSGSSRASMRSRRSATTASSCALIRNLPSPSNRRVYCAHPSLERQGFPMGHEKIPVLQRWIWG